MSQARRPYDHTLHAINELNTQVNEITTWPTGQPRPLDARMTAAVLQVRGQLAIASALLAVADAIREHTAGPPPADWPATTGGER